MRLKLIQIINFITIFACLFLCATSIFYFPYQKVAFYLFFTSYFVEVILERKWENIHFDKKSIYFLIMIFFFLLAILHFPFEHSSKYFSYLTIKRLSIFGFASIGILGLNKNFKLSYFLNTFIITSVITICYLIVIRIGVLEFIKNPLRADLFSTERNLHVNLHMMFNFYLNISILSIWYILTQSWNKTVWWKRYLYIAALTLIFYILSMTEGRSGFIAGIIVMFCFIFYEIWKRKKSMGIIIGLLFPFFLFGIASLHKRMSEKMIESEPRLFLWESAVSVIKDQPVFGYGISDAQEHFDIARAKYQTEEFRLGTIKNPRLDCHSQYLQTTMEYGIFGLLILLFIYFYPIWLADKNRKLFSVLLLFLCAYQSVFDMFITGQFSAIFGILILLILCADNNIILNRNRKTLVN